VHGLKKMFTVSMQNKARNIRKTNAVIWGHPICTLCPQKIPDIFDCNFKTNYQILIVFGTNIPDTTCHQITVQFPISPNVCFCTT